MLYDGKNKIECIEHIVKNNIYTKRVAYFGFRFAMKYLEFRYETQNGTVDPGQTSIHEQGTSGSRCDIGYRCSKMVYVEQDCRRV